MKFSKNTAFLLLHQFFQESHIFIETRYIFWIFMMKDFPFLWNEYDVIATCCTYLCDRIIETTTEEVTSDGSTRVFPGKYDSKTIVSNFVREDIRYESIRKKRFTKS